MSRGRPSAHGAVLGRLLADWATRGASDVGPRPCSSCAFREGTIGNLLAGTVGEALNCTLGIDDAPFGCHKGMDENGPTRPCAGWLAARRFVAANFGDASEGLALACDEVSESGERPDEVRARFDEFLSRVDPDGRLDDYRLADLWQREARR